MDLDDPTGGSTKVQPPPPSADYVEMVDLLVSPPSPTWAQLLPPSTVLYDPLPWSPRSSPIFSPPRYLEDESEMIPASDSFQLFQSWSPMGAVDMLWTFDGAHIPYPGMSSGAPNFNLVAAAPLAPQFNVAVVTESVSGPAIRRSHRGFRILNYVLCWIFYVSIFNYPV
jgi:hypothetical protein